MSAPRFSGSPRRIRRISNPPHLGFHIDGVDGLTEILERELPGLRPDLCVLTGDYRFEDSGDCAAVYPRMRRIVKSIHSRHGVYAILGNHDAAEMVSALDEFGARMLMNEAVE